MTRVKAVTTVRFLIPNANANATSPSIEFHSWSSSSLLLILCTVPIVYSLQRLCSCMDGFETSETQRTSHTSEMDPERENETRSQDSRVKESITEWTDVKHSLYLKSMEASFVNQLYNSMNIPGWISLKRNDVASSRQIHRSPSGQFKVLRGGSWQKVNFERPEFQLNKAHDTHSVLATPWIRRFKSECKPKTLASPNPPGIAGSKIVINLNAKKAMFSEAASISEHIDPTHCHNELVGSDAEVSDQNFIDEEFEGEKGSSICSSKKMKTEIPEASSHDQAPLTENSP